MPHTWPLKQPINLYRQVFHFPFPQYFTINLTVYPCFVSQPGNYHQTVKRTEDAFQACNDIVACFQERARVERQYAQQLSEWSTKWKPLVDASEYCSFDQDALNKKCIASCILCSMYCILHVISHLVFKIVNNCKWFATFICYLFITLQQF